MNIPWRRSSLRHAKSEFRRFLKTSMKNECVDPQYCFINNDGVWCYSDYHQTTLDEFALDNSTHIIRKATRDEWDDYKVFKRILQNP